MATRPHRTIVALLAAGILCLAATGTVFAHVVEHAGPYTLEIGWAREPTFVGESNGVQVIVMRDQKPVTDLAADDLKVVVSTGDQQSGELNFEPGFDPVEMQGPLGEYDAAIVPTAPGDYTFHLTGTVDGQAVDVTVSSGDETFNAVQGTSDLEFPAKLPTVPEIVTRLDRIDARIAPPGAAPGPTQASVDAASAKAADAVSVADRALLIGGGLGIVGIAIGALGVVLALRANRRPAA